MRRPCCAPQLGPARSQLLTIDTLFDKSTISAVQTTALTKVGEIVDCAPRCTDGPSTWSQRSLNRLHNKTSYANMLPVTGHQDYQKLVKRPKSTTKRKADDVDESAHTSGKRPKSDDVDESAHTCGAAVWKRAQQANGKVYWHDTETREAQWEHPASSEEKELSVKVTRSHRPRVCPIPKSKLKKIDKGCHADGVYREKLEKLLALKQKHRDEHKPGLVGRKAKVDILLQPREGCTCKWSPSLQTWTRPCAKCSDLKAWYMHDRGFNRNCRFRKAGIPCLIPTRKDIGQVVFSQAAPAADRHISSERITIERNNAELRGFDGFDCKIPLSGISLAGAEASYARGGDKSTSKTARLGGQIARRGGS